MLNKKIMKSALIAFSCLMFAVPTNTYAAGSTTNQTVPKSATTQTSNNNMSKTARALGGIYNAKTNTITLKSNTKLSKNVKINNNKSLTLNMNGKKITGGSITINNASKAPVIIKGHGKIINCQIFKWGSGKLTLDGDITYKHSSEDILLLREGTTVIRNGNFYCTAKNKDILWSDYLYEYDQTYLYIKGGNFHGDIYLSNCATYIKKGTLDGKIYLYCGGLYIQGGTIQKGIYDTSDDDSSFKIDISGGKILDQIVLHYGNELIMSGGIIQSDQDAVIQSDMPEGDEYSHGDIRIQGGTIISAKENGYGIKAVNTEIELSGGTIKNTTAKGNTAVYSVRYNNNVKDINVKKNDAVSFISFQSDLNNLYKENYCGENVQYHLDDNGTLTISGTGDMFTSIDFGSMDHEKLEKKIKIVMIEEGVTAVGGFDFCSHLKSVSLPSSLKTIYHLAFYHCTALESVTMKSGLEKIGSIAFMDDHQLKEINIPDTVTTIGEQAFDSCYKLEKVHLSNNLNELTDFMFHHCYNLKSVEIPDTITEIPYGAFYGCTKLASVKLPANLKKINATAFISCVNLTEIEIPSTVKEIGRSAFKNCRKLETVNMTISEDMVIHKSAFKDTPYAQNKDTK